MTWTDQIDRAIADCKAKGTDILPLFRMGDFYELFYDDAKTAARVLGLTITARHGVLMAGFPYHQLESYLRKLLAAGLRVAIMEQDEPFTLDPTPSPIKPVRTADVPQRQKVLLEGLDALPGQLDLF